MKPAATVALPQPRSLEQVVAAAVGTDALAAKKLIRSAAAATLEGKVAAVARATQQAANAETRRTRFADLDERIASDRAEMIKRDKVGPLPERLRRELEERNEASEQVREMAGALGVLEGEQKAAEKALQEAEKSLKAEAYKVMLTEAAAMADEMCAAYPRIWSLGDRIVGLDLLLNGFVRQITPLPAPGQIMTETPPAGMELLGELRKVLSAMKSKSNRPYAPTIAADRNREAVEQWRKRLEELCK